MLQHAREVAPFEIHEGAPTTELITDLIRVKLETALLVTHKTIMQ